MLFTDRIRSRRRAARARGDIHRLGRDTRRTVKTAGLEARATLLERAAETLTRLLRG